MIKQDRQLLGEDVCYAVDAISDYCYEDDDKRELVSSLNALAKAVQESPEVLVRVIRWEADKAEEQMTVNRICPKCGGALETEYDREDQWLSCTECGKRYDTNGL